MADRIEITILPDGTVKSVTETVGVENHQSAEGFFGMISRLTGGAWRRDRRGKHAQHQQHQDEQIRQSN